MNALQYLADFFSDIFNWCYNIVFFVISKSFSWISDLSEFYFSRMLSNTVDPSSYSSLAVNILKFYYIVDSWVNVGFGISLFSSFLTFCTIFILVKFILKLVPTIG